MESCGSILAIFFCVTIVQLSDSRNRYYNNPVFKQQQDPKKCSQTCNAPNCASECVGYESNAECHGAYCTSATRGQLSQALCHGGKCNTMVKNIFYGYFNSNLLYFNVLGLFLFFKLYLIIKNNHSVCMSA